METERFNPECCLAVVFPPTKVCKVASCADCLITHHYRWSFGGNRLQIKAEARLMEDVDTALRDVASIGSQANDIFHSLVTKQDLLHLLIDNEQTRLEVWLYPLDHERRHFFPSRHASKTPLEVRWPQ